MAAHLACCWSPEHTEHKIRKHLAGVVLLDAGYVQSVINGFHEMVKVLGASEEQFLQSTAKLRNAVEGAKREQG
jgi:hypothetical protein